MTNLLIKNTPPYLFFTSNEYRTFLWLLCRYGNVPRYVPRYIHFLKYNFLVPDCASFIGQFREIFFEEAYRFSTNSSTPVIYDCGANIGTSCLYFRYLYPSAKIKAFEADPKIFTILKKNLSSNNIHDIELLNKAVWSSHGKIDFITDGADGGSIYEKKGNHIEVETIKLKELLEQEDQIDLLKMDIEGAEFEVLNDCAESLEKVENLFVEYHSWNSQKQQLGRLLNMLAERGFRYYFENINQHKSPFLNKNCATNIDFQVNIFAYRNFASSK